MSARPSESTWTMSKRWSVGPSPVRSNNSATDGAGRWRRSSRQGSEFSLRQAGQVGGSEFDVEAAAPGAHQHAVVFVHRVVEYDREAPAGPERAEPAPDAA